MSQPPLTSRPLFREDGTAACAAGEGWFLAVDAPGFNAEKGRRLSPRLMSWHRDTCWLVDLSPCLGYWRSIAARRGSDLQELLHGMLREMLPGDDERPGFYAATAPCPWQALLLLEVLQERDLPGFADRHSFMGSALYQRLSWDGWWRQTAAMAVSLKAAGLRRFHPDVFRRQSVLMQKAVSRLSLPGPGAIRFSPEQIRRRFGSIMARLWEQAFFDREEPAPADFFPWQGHREALPPFSKRHADWPLSQWQHIEPLLREDLNRLCRHEDFRSDERITGLEWRLTLQDLATLHVPVLFRHPHRLHGEIPHQSTALLQARYSFDRETARFMAASGHEPTDPPPVVISWQLTASERLLPAPATADIFRDPGQGEEEDFLRLENKLAVPLRSYAGNDDWLPEDSFDEAGDQQPAPSGHQTLLQSGRPLFIYDKPRPLQTGGRSTLRRFSERTMHKWWREQPRDTAVPLQRDYYRLFDDRQRNLWVFRDNTGQWFLHGLYS